LKIITMPRNLQYPMSRSGGEGDVYLMHEGWEYVSADGLVLQIKEQESRDFAVRDIEANWEGQQDYEPGDTLTVLCPGGIGDLLVLRSVFAAVREQYPGLLIHLVATPQDTFWMGPYIDKLSPYPVLLDVVESYKYIASLEDIHRQSPMAELFDAFADVLHVELPAETPQRSAPFVLNAAETALAKKRLHSDSGRPKIGVQVSSAAHYRSYPNHMTALMALELTREGHRRADDQLFDVYLFGTMFQTIRWREDGAEVDPPPNIIDLTGKYQTNAEMVALIAEMDVLVVPDSAILHIGAWLDIPTLALFSITLGTSRTTYYPNCMFIQGEAECAPCQNIARFPSCGEKYCKAMTSISPYWAADIAAQMYAEGGIVKEGVPYDPRRHGPAELTSVLGGTGKDAANDR